MSVEKKSSLIRQEMAAYNLKQNTPGSSKGSIQRINKRDKLHSMSSIQFSEQKSLHSFKTKGPV